MKKIFTIFLITVMMMGICNFSLVSATETETLPVYDVELFTGGDVESATATTAGGNWMTPVPYATDTTEVWLENMEVHGGLNSIKLVAKNPDATTYSNVSANYLSSNQPDSVTQTTGWIKVTDLSEGSYVLVNLYYGALSDSRNLYARNEIRTTGDWKQIMCVTDTAFVGNVYVDIRLYGSGTCYIDDFSTKDVQNLISPQMGQNVFGNVIAGSSVLGENHYLTEAEKLVGRQSLFLGWTAAKTSPRIETWLSSARSKLHSGEKYRLSFWFKPVTEGGGSPTVMIGNNTNAYSNRALTLDYYWDSLERGAVQNGWQEYHAYFTMPEVNAANTLSIALACYGEVNNGYYDGFTLVKDYEEPLKVVGADGKETKTAKAGGTITLKKHVISDKTEAEGGKKLSYLIGVYAEENGVSVCKDIVIVNKVVYDGVELRKPATGAQTIGDYLKTSGAEDVTYDYEIPAEYAGCTIKAIAWNGARTLLPLGNAFEITVEAAAN